VDVITPEQWAALKRLIREHAMLTLACREGVFLGAVQSMGQSEGGVTLTFLPTEKLM
ncbi:MAG: hypothetical protein GX751_12305, partial [Desulfuromonadaceae bacterium]|nr:hypothetical protein [Desulfuromonadaceae bacterium]